MIDIPETDDSNLRIKDHFMVGKFSCNLVEKC